MATESQLRNERSEVYASIRPLIDKVNRGERLSAAESRAVAEAHDRILASNVEIVEARDTSRLSHAETASMGGTPSFGAKRSASPASPSLKGEPNELLAPGVTMRQWVEAAAANGVSIQVGDAQNGRMERVVTRDREFMNDFYGGITGVSQSRFSRTAVDEVRTLGEGSAGSTISPISFSADVIDYLYANSVLGKVGATRVPMAAQQVRVPQFTGVPSPTWIAENGSISLDAGPAFSSLQLDASGGFKDITLISLELAQDAYVAGGLTDYLAQQIATRMAIAVDSAAFYGIASNPGNPGFSNEAGVNVRKYAAHTGTTGTTPADTTELSTMAEIVRNANAEPTAFVCSPQFAGTLSRLNASTYAKFWDIPADVTGQWDNRVISTTVPVTETDPASGSIPAQTGGTYTSVYLADWSRLLLGVRLDMTIQTLRERYVDSGQIGLFAFGRYSTRLSHPEAAVRSYGVSVG